MNEDPHVISGSCFKDKRGELFFNNNFDFTMIKRMYIIKNKDTSIERGWIGHKIEQRWFCASSGKFLISLIKIDNWDSPNINLQQKKYILNAKKLDILFIPKGYVTLIKSLKESSKLIVMADFLMGKINDVYRFDQSYFKEI